MDAPDDSPQIGSVDVDREVLNERGTRLAQLIEELGLELATESASDAPTDGWRVLQRHTGGVTLLGAPVGPEGDSWRLANVAPDNGIRIVHIQPNTARLRPSRAERRRPLELRWPTVMQTGGDLEDFAIDIVNTGSTRWLPNEDTFHVLGTFAKPGVENFSFGWARSDKPEAVPLDPQDYARASIHINPAVWAGLEPGDYDLHAILTGLDLRAAAPLRVKVTAEMIARHSPQAPQPQRTLAEHRASVESQIRKLDGLLSAGASVANLAQTVAAAPTDEDALSRIRDLIVCDEQTARAIYGASLRVLRPGNAITLQHQIDVLTQYLEEM